MVKNKRALEKFERKLSAGTRPDYRANVKAFERLLIYAKQIGKFPPKDPLDGIEVDIRIARILNSVK